LVNGATFSQKPLLYANVDGEAIFEGDIVLGSVQDLQQTRDVALRSIGITGSQFRWPNGVVPYEIDPGLPNQQRVTDAIAHWEANTTIRFTLRTAANQAHLSANKVASKTSRLAPVAQRATRSTRSATPSVCGMSKAEKIVTTL
jgi:hypothetical protein